MELLGFLAALFVVISSIVAARQTKRTTKNLSLPHGVSAPWPIDIEGFELPSAIGIPGRKSRRRSWEWHPVRVTVTGENVTVTGIEGEIFRAPREEVTLTLLPGNMGAGLAHNNDLVSITATTHKTRLRLPPGELIIHNRKLHHQLSLALAGQVPQADSNQSSPPSA